MSATTKLLATLDRQPFGARAKTVSAWARTAKPADVDAALARLSTAAEAWERCLAVSLAAGAQRWPVVLAALGDPSLWVRRTALHRAPAADVPASLLVAAALAAPAQTRKELADAVHRARRPGLAAALGHALVARGDVVGARSVLSECAVELLEAVFAAHGPGALPLGALAVRQPALVLRWLTSELAVAATEAEAAAVWRAFHAALRPLSVGHAAALLDAWEQHGPRGQLPTRDGPVWAAWLRADPARAVALAVRALTLGRAPAPATLLHRARTLPDGALQSLAAALADANPAWLTPLLDALPPSRRAACFEAAYAGKDLAAATLPEPLLAVLPHALRHAHARRLRALPRAQRDEAVALGWTPFLPVDEARAALAPSLRAPLGEVRAQAWQLWTRAVLTDRSGLDALVAGLPRLHNEQDPVRAAAAQGLAALPGARFTPAHLPALEALTVAVAQARDTSTGTRAALVGLAHRLLVADEATPDGARFQAGLRMLLTLAGQRPVLQFPSPWPLAAHAARRVVDTLGPWFDAELARDVTANVLALAEALGDKAGGLDALQARLETIVFTAPAQDAWPRARAVHLWLKAGRTRDARVRRLLDWDASAVTLFPVWSHLHRRRQDWLDGFLDGKRLTGRFGSEKAGWLFPALDGFTRWLPRQQRAFLATLRRVVDDAGHHTGTRALALRRVCRLPVATLELLAPFLGSADVVLAEAALGGAVWLDVARGVGDVLLPHAGTDRARVAVYGLGRLLRVLPDGDGDGLLRKLFGAASLKLTSLKEAVRLFGARPGDAVSQALLERWRDPATHRDVRGALVHGARRRLDAAAWEILEGAARHAERGVAEAALAALAWLPPAHRARGGALWVALAGHPVQEVRRAALAFVATQPSAARAAGVDALRAAFSVLQVPGAATPWPEAARAAAALSALVEPSVLEPLVAALTSAVRAEPLAAEPPAEDLPLLRRLAALLDAVTASPPAERDRLSAARAVLRAATVDVVGVEPQRFDLGLVELPVDARVADALVRLGLDVSAGLDGAGQADAVAGWLTEASRRATADGVVSLAAALEAPAPWLALGATQGGLQRFGPVAALRARLTRLRELPTTAAAARRVVVSA